MPKVRLIRGDATKTWPVEDNSVDSVVTDPPYGISFMGRKWDDKGGPESYQAWTTLWAREAYRTLKPGGFLLAFGGTRTYHRMAVGIEEAGFRIVDMIEWLYLTGFPKAQDIGKMFDIRAGASRDIVGFRKAEGGNNWDAFRSGEGRQDRPSLHKAKTIPITAPATPLAQKWDGWKTPNLKPAHEPIIMAQKPFKGTFCDNIERWGVGAINVDGCRIPYREGTHPTEMYGASWAKSGVGKTITWNGDDYRTTLTAGDRISDLGRFPANVVTLDEDEWYSPYFNITPKELSKKTSPSERRGHGWKNTHPTVKPVYLVRWLQRLVTPPGGTTMSPFLGSGTDAVAAVLEGFNFIGMDVSDEYWPIVYGRLNDLAKTAKFELIDEEVRVPMASASGDVSEFPGGEHT